MTRRQWLHLAALPLAATAGPSDLRQPRPPRESDPTGLSLVELTARLREGRLSPVEVIDAYLRRIDEADRDVHAYVTVTAERARARAKALRAARRRLPLYGAPIAHKDLFETAGVRTTAGSRLFEQHIPDRDATLVSRLAEGGAVVLGKTNTHELGGGVTTINPFFGTTRNPRDLTRIAGGSSGGSAAAVAARLAVAATGTDTGGSIRIPAALCGCVGFKPTYGVLSTAGVRGACPTFDHTGFLTRCVADLVPLMQAGMGLDPADPATVPPLTVDTGPAGTLQGVRIGVARRFFFDGLDAEVASALDRTLAYLARAGAAVRDVLVPVDDRTMARVFDPIAVAEIHETYAEAWRTRREGFSPAFAALFEAPLPTGLELAAAHRARRRFQVDLAAAFEAVDVLLTPTVPIVAPALAGPIDGGLILRNTWPFNAARLPAITLPCGAGDRLPVGLQLVGRPFDDARVLKTAAAAERILAGR